MDKHLSLNSIFGIGHPTRDIFCLHMGLRSERNMGWIWDSELFDFAIFYINLTYDWLGKIIKGDLELYIRANRISRYKKTNFMIIYFLKCLCMVFNK